jgi:hypothetical protein
LWQLAYTELYFTPTLWPDFDAACLDEALTWFQARERRFGRTSEQLAQIQGRAVTQGRPPVLAAIDEPGDKRA